MTRAIPFTAYDVESEIARIVSTVLNTDISQMGDDIGHEIGDSLMRLEIMTLVEQRFEISLSEDIVTQFTSVSRIARLVRRHIGDVTDNRSENSAYRFVDSIEETR